MLKGLAFLHICLVLAATQGLIAQAVDEWRQIVATAPGARRQRITISCYVLLILDIATAFIVLAAWFLMTGHAGA